MEHRSEVLFLLNDQPVSVSDTGASDTLLDYLRLERRLTGTKEGCAEGDCGACTVLVGRLGEAGLVYEPVNACIRFLASVDGCHVVTVEHLRGRDGQLHPVQQAMVDHHGSQCGFCTPGFVMALYALWMQHPKPTEKQVETALQGNLCRCTGYQPIVLAAMAASEYGSPASDYLTTQRQEITARLQGLKDGRRVVCGPADNQAILPSSVDDLADVLQAHPDATIIAGATDVGLWVTKFLQEISPAVFIAHLDELKAIAVEDDCITVGAGASYTDCETAIAGHFPHLSEYWNRIAGWQVRNMGTVGGNIANGSPIGDTPPVLIALGAEITLRKGSEQRSMALEDFFIEYGKQDRKAGEFVEKIRIPRPAANQIDAAYKISKRRDEDISSLAAGISVVLTENVITGCAIAFGGMAATPKRAAKAEAALLGQTWSQAAFDSAAIALLQDFKPLTDWRASAQYRMLSAQNLLRRFYLENDSATTGPVRLASA